MVEKNISKRRFLALLGTTAGAVSLGSSDARAATYSNTVDIVDAGADNTGNTPIDDVLDSVVADDTLVEFPSGTYLLEQEHDFTRSTNVGLVGTDGKSQTTLEVDDTFSGDTLFDFGTSGSYASTNVEIRGFTFDQTASGAGTMFFWAYMTDGLLIEDIDVVGAVEGPRSPGKGEILFRLDIMNSGGNGTVRRVRANDGGIEHPDGDPPGPAFYVGGAHAGHVLFEDCECAKWLDNGLYTSNAAAGGGDVTIRGGVFKNNDIGNVRIGGANTLVEDVTIIQDETSHMADDLLNPRGLFCRNGNATVRNVDITYKDGAGSSWPILIRDTYGDLTLENVTIDHQTGNPAIYDKGSDSLSISGATVKATVDGANLVEGASDGSMSIDQSCFQVSTGSRDGVDANSVPTTIDNTNINVSGTEILGSDVTTSSISTDLACSLDNDDESSSENTFEVIAAEDSGGAFDYEFTADGPVAKVTDAGKNSAEGNDKITDNGDGTYTVSGRTGSGYGDTFSVEGDVIAFSAETDASNFTLWWNGEQVSVDSLNQ